MPKISVVIPVYNSEDTIGACIESVLQQSFSDFELIIIDDGSIDLCGKICDDYGLRDHRISVVHQSNRGRTEARWQGVTRAHGEWLCLFDCLRYSKILFSDTSS